MPRPRKPVYDGPKRRLVAEFVSDQAVDVSRLEAEIAISGRSQQARDQQLVSLAIGALIVVTDQVRQQNKTRYPSAVEIHDYIIQHTPELPAAYSVLAEAFQGTQ